MLEDLIELMDAASRRCEYADVRRVVTLREGLTVRNGSVERIDTVETAGLGVRVRVRGAWGFAATSDWARGAGQASLARALAIAEAQPAISRVAPLAPTPPARGDWAGPCELDPFAVSVEAKLELLLGAEAALRGDPRIVRAGADCLSERTVKAFASTEGAGAMQTTTVCGAGLFAVAVSDGALQVRSYPAQHGGSVVGAGWEHVQALDLVGEAPRVAQDALALLDAPDCPAGVTTVVLDAEQVALQLHESVGHALELDRILGGEAAYAGTSWVGPRDLGTLRYGSQAMNVTADATLSHGLGSFAWDDEGVPARQLPLIRDGVLRTALSSREAAAEIGLEASGGCARADGYARPPIVRMTNVSLDPGEAASLDELIADIDEGLYLETNRSWSIDDRRLNFQFATEVGREIRGGRLGRLVRNPSYAGITPQFWAALEAVAGPGEWRLHGVSNCGKGEPGQVMRVSHGTAPARFRGVQVGVA